MFLGDMRGADATRTREDRCADEWQTRIKKHTVRFVGSPRLDECADPSSVTADLISFN
jgi:hypothetical protein